MRPRLLDWALLAYLAALAATPALMAAGAIPSGRGALFLGLFPGAPFCTALALILLRSLVPALRLEFGLPLDRWATICALLLGGGFFAHAMAPFTFGPHELQTLLSISISTIIALALIIPLGLLFAGQAVGPRRTPAQRARAQH